MVMTVRILFISLCILLCRCPAAQCEPKFRLPMHMAIGVRYDNMLQANSRQILGYCTLLQAPEVVLPNNFRLQFLHVAAGERTVADSLHSFRWRGTLADIDIPLLNRTRGYEASPDSTGTRTPGTLMFFGATICDYDRTGNIDFRGRWAQAMFGVGVRRISGDLAVESDVRFRLGLSSYSLGTDLYKELGPDVSATYVGLETDADVTAHVRYGSQIMQFQVTFDNILSSTSLHTLNIAATAVVAIPPAITPYPLVLTLRGEREFLWFAGDRTARTIVRLGLQTAVFSF